MQQQLIQMMAALANHQMRRRFADVEIGGGAGVPGDPDADRLLVAAGALEELPDGRVRISGPGLRALLDHARGTLEPKPEGKVDLLPRQHRLRLEVLGKVADAVLGADERIPEKELNARLGDQVLDIPGVRRALVDEGLVAREADGHAYWRLG
ncbi:DUF2087 domain-containing protein [Sinomonas mesophila]|uniref:DUF2087 domain-containing protein n=1 Tax=Sinomonas mesophila TaxID=1531955 RepID=UPI00158BFC60|nr:DUF2087 domain-containing protein [Sinomonas mesophila]